MSDAPNPTARHLLPFAAAALGVGFLSLMDAFMKDAALTTGTYTATVLRSLVGAAIIAPFWFWQRNGWPDRATMKLHIERGIISAFMALSFFFALTKLPLAEAIAISFIAPLIALYLARRTWCAIPVRVIDFGNTHGANQDPISRGAIVSGSAGSDARRSVAR